VSPISRQLNIGALQVQPELHGVISCQS
jgi:hypothetical protein